MLNYFALTDKYCNWILVMIHITKSSIQVKNKHIYLFLNRKPKIEVITLKTGQLSNCYKLEVIFKWHFQIHVC